MKCAKGRLSAYRSLRRVRNYDAYGVFRPRHLLVSLIFIMSTLSLSLLNLNMNINATVIAPDNPIETRSTDGTRGASSPYEDILLASESEGGDTINLSNLVNSKNNVNKSNNGSSAIAPKPAWTKMQLFRDPYNSATQYVNANPSASGVDYIARMGQVPVAQWFGDWDADISYDVNVYVSAAASVNAVPVLVIYNIPVRDCGGYSTGGANEIVEYTNWVKKVAGAIGSRTAVVILEPDALGAIDCLSTVSLQDDRYKAISQAVGILKSNSSTYVYIDAGTALWQPVGVMSERLRRANIDRADGFSINVSYYASNQLNQSYGDALSSAVGNKHFVVDTSRNGGNITVSGAMCNPSGAALGTQPTFNTGDVRNDAYLWIKIPWESDGPCNGSPNPGVGFWSYAVQLAKNAGW